MNQTKSKPFPGLVLTAIALCTVAMLLSVVFVWPRRIPPTMNLSSPAFKNNGTIPTKYTCDGGDIIPPLQFSDISDEAKTLTLVMEDPDAPSGIFDHWVVFNMPLSVTGIEEGVEPQGIRGNNSTGKVGYKGPCPPSGVHHYIFTLYALDTELPLLEGASKKDILEAMASHIVDRAKWVGLYGKSR
ncbi:MAG TPA: YbhB/YbcL family Raf kinase inhibitor-like protein [Candidatus Paceibacterota bacterium]